MAHKTEAELKTEINNNIADNNAGNISAQNVREAIFNTADSIVPIVQAMDNTTPFSCNIKVGDGTNGCGIVTLSGIQFTSGDIQNKPFPGLDGIQHSGLAGLTGPDAATDPHAEYVNTNGIRNITGNMGMRGWVSESGASSNLGIKFDDENGQVKFGNLTNKPTTVKFDRDSSTLDSAKGAARAWMRWSGSDGVSNSGISVKSAFNIHTLRRMSAGKWQITFPSGTFSDNNLVPVGNSNGRGDDDSAEDFDINVVGIVATSGNDAPLLRGMSYQVKNISNQYVNAGVNTLVVYGNGVGTTSTSGTDITIVDDLGIS